MPEPKVAGANQIIFDFDPKKTTLVVVPLNRLARIVNF